MRGWTQQVKSGTNCDHVGSNIVLHLAIGPIGAYVSTRTSTLGGKDQLLVGIHSRQAVTLGNPVRVAEVTSAGICIIVAPAAGISVCARSM